MKKTLLFLCLVLASVNTTFAQTYEVPFTGLAAEGAEFYMINEAPANALQGTLTSITVNAVLDDSDMATFANDLTVYVTVNDDINSDGILQVGGYSNFGTPQRLSWTTGDSDEPGTPITGTVTLTTPINFSGTSYTIWIGNGYYGTGSYGVWSGTITFNGITEATASANDFLASKLTVFPNPVNDVVTVSNNNNVLVSEIAINDVKGRTVKTVKLNAVAEAQVNVSELNSGIYFMNITTNEGVTTKKIIKK